MYISIITISMDISDTISTYIRYRFLSSDLLAFNLIFMSSSHRLPRSKLNPIVANKINITHQIHDSLSKAESFNCL